MNQDNQSSYIQGFSKWGLQKKLEFMSSLTGIDINVLMKYAWPDEDIANIINKLSENTVAHFPFPYGLAPNFKIQDETHVLPLVTEESSVVAALANAAKIWYTKGGFRNKVLGTIKKGQIHVFWSGQPELFFKRFSKFKSKLLDATRNISGRMEKRGGGVLGVELLDKTKELPNYYQLDVSFNTLDAMGANFINTVLEKMAQEFEKNMAQEFPGELPVEVVMSILSNFTPDCLVKAWVECPIESLDDVIKGMPGAEFASRFQKAIQISQVDVSRAVTHNKGIFNGIDALALATGNDWRAIESAGHAYAARSGKYQGLTKVYIDEKMFSFSIELPMNIGVVGGVTNLHPMAALSMKILKNPSGNELMGMFAVVGLASNFAAITALIGQGIQQGHMKLHLDNILQQLGADKNQSQKAREFFKGKTVSYANVEEYISNLK